MTNLVNNLINNSGSSKVLYKGIAHTSIFIASIVIIGFIIYMLHTSKSFRIKTPLFEIERHKNGNTKTKSNRKKK